MGSACGVIASYFALRLYGDGGHHSTVPTSCTARALFIDALDMSAALCNDAVSSVAFVGSDTWRWCYICGFLRALAAASRFGFLF